MCLSKASALSFMKGMVVGLAGTDARQKDRYGEDVDRHGKFEVEESTAEESSIVIRLIGGGKCWVPRRRRRLPSCIGAANQTTSITVHVAGFVGL